MPKLAIIFFLSIITFSSQAKTSKEVCNLLTPSIKDIAKQLPIDVDYMTTLVGVSNIYASNICLVNYSYLVESKKLVEEIQQGLGGSYQEALDFATSPEGISALHEAFTENAIESVDASMSTLKRIKGMKVSYLYTFDTYDFKKYIATGLDTRH